jgi:hypothetical protein
MPKIAESRQITMYVEHSSVRHRHRRHPIAIAKARTPLFSLLVSKMSILDNFSLS